MTAVKTVRIVVWGLVAVLAAVTLWVVVMGRSVAPTTEQAAIGGPFTLVNADGQPVTDKAFAGRAHAIFFGYTHCPDVCPTTLAEFAVLTEKLGADAAKLDIVFITVDPSRDTPAVLKSYLSSFSNPVIGLTGSEEQVADAVAKFRVYRKKVPGEDGEYTMDHTAAVFLFDASGAFRGTLSYNEPQDDAFAKLKRIL